MTHRWTIYGGKAARYKPEFGDDVTPSMGFNWWYWLPRAYTNGASLKRNECFDITVTWLCFWVSATAYPRAK